MIPLFHLFPSLVISFYKENRLSCSRVFKLWWDTRWQASIALDAEEQNCLGLQITLLKFSDFYSKKERSAKLLPVSKKQQKLTLLPSNTITE